MSHYSQQQGRDGRTHRLPYWADVIEKEHGRLFARAYAFTRLRSAYMWCDCRCGKKSIAVRASYLRTGHTVSCYCVGRELSRRRIICGVSNEGLPEYRVWEAIVRRGQDIADPRWCRSFVAFYADVGAPPHDSTRAVRRERKKPWNKENFQWKER